MMANSVASLVVAQLSRISWAEWIAALTIFTIIYTTTTITYNLYFHPLRHYPGPRAYAATSLPWGLSLVRGTLPWDTHTLHETYGRVVRIRPNELAFADAQSWQDIYGHKVAGKKAGLAPGVKELPKYLRFYKSHPRQPDSLISSGHEDHTRWRRMMAPGFSEKSMRAQEPLIMRYVDLLMARLRERSGDAVDIVTWYNWTTFDIIEDLAFGDAYGSLEHSRRHPFIGLISSGFKQSSRLVFLRYMGLPKLSYLALFSLLRKGLAMRRHGARVLRNRMASPDPRPDLIEPLLSNRDEGGLSFRTLSTMTAGLLLAGSETTASTLSGVTWLLLSNPEKLEKLTSEVRDTFGHESEINFTSVQGLGYMLGCLNEGLRMYPPVAIGLPRQVPRGGAVISGDYVPERTIVSVYQWSANHMSSSWAKPFEFIPERFLGDERFRNDKQASMKPFSVGPRDCIGKNLAYVEMRVILARIIWNFDMKLAEGGGDWISGQKNFLLWNKPPLKVVLTPVER